MTAPATAQLRIGEVVANKVGPFEITVYLVVDNGCVLQVGAPIRFGDRLDGPPLTLGQLTHDGRFVESVTGPAKVSTQLPTGHRLVANGTAVLI